VNIEDGFRDLAPLDPSRDEARWERMVARVGAAAAPELARRARTPHPGALLLLSTWSRPAAGAAALVTAAAALVLALTPAPTVEAAAPDTLAGALFPAPLAAWMETGSAPSVEELMVALEGGSR
jgi:hypothetical protein